MRLNSLITRLAELVLIAAMGGIGAYAFLASSAYDNVKAYGELHNIGFISYLPLIIWLFIGGFGVINIVLFNRGSGVFAWLTAIFCLPSLLAHNSIKWPEIFGLDIELTTTLGFNSMLVLGVLVIGGYVILNYLRFFRESERSIIKRQADPGDVEAVNGFSNLSLFLSVCGALAVTALVAFLARGLEAIIVGAVQKMPWNTVFIGLACFLLLAFYLYWLSARRHEKKDR